MRLPALTDTIVAVSTGWQPAPLGIVRLSGPESFRLVARLGITVPDLCDRRSFWTEGRACLGGEVSCPVTVFWFPGPHSYTGDDLVELHTIGCLPLLTALRDRLAEWGARLALPGEFTARAFQRRKLDAAGVERVLNLLRVQDDAAARELRRRQRDSHRATVSRVVDELTDLLARIEAGIDFVEEEDIRFVSPAEVCATLDRLAAEMESCLRGSADPHAGLPHVLVAGLANAGKSTLFNRLAGTERALTSPIEGTTRDVLSARVELDGCTLVLQDCAGFGTGGGCADEAARAAAQATLRQADVILWLHAADMPWQSMEVELCRELPVERMILVRNKIDLATAGPRSDEPTWFTAALDVSALRGDGLDELRARLGRLLGEWGVAEPQTDGTPAMREALEALRRARALSYVSAHDLTSPELISLELRLARSALVDWSARTLDEAILDRIYTEFCVGK